MPSPYYPSQPKKRTKNPRAKASTAKVRTFVRMLNCTVTSQLKEWIGSMHRVLLQKHQKLPVERLR